MTIALLADLEPVWADRIAAALGEGALVLRAGESGEVQDLLWSVPVAVVFTSLEPLSRERLAAFQRLAQTSPQAVKVCLVSAEGLEAIRREQIVSADLWLPVSAEPAAVAEVARTALEMATLRLSAAALPPGVATGSDAAKASELLAPESALFQRLFAAWSAGFDVDRLLTAYVEAVRQYARCASFCLLWRSGGSEDFTVYAAQGLPRQMVSVGRLRASDALPRWYLHNCRVLTRAELATWSDPGLAGTVLREMEAFRGHLALPLMVGGRLAGILLLGEKAIGTPYAPAELETLFMLSSYVALQVQSFLLHQQIARDKAYTERILAGMSSGVITLSQDERIAICNPYAAKILGFAPGELEGRDLRALPSPLGDYLYAALRSPQEVVRAEEISVRGGTLTLRVSTSHLADERGDPLGSVLLLDDMTAQIALVTERHRRERLDMLTQVVSSLAHEVRTPLTAIKTYAELAGVRKPAEDLRAFWQDTVMPQIDRLDSLINQLVQLVQQPEPSFELVRLEGLVEEATAALRQLEPDEEPVVEMEVSRPLAWTVADPAQTRRALSYLLRFLGGEERSPVRVRVEQEATESGEVVTVSLQRLKRTTTHLPPEEIFDPLCILRENETDLGPAISRRLIENQGGTIRAHAEGGRLEFQVRFPATALTTAPSSTSPSSSLPRR